MHIIATVFNLTRIWIDESRLSDDEDFNSGNRRSQIVPAIVWLVLVTFPRRGKVAGT